MRVVTRAGERAARQRRHRGRSAVWPSPAFTRDNRWGGGTTYSRPPLPRHILVLHCMYPVSVLRLVSLISYHVLGVFLLLLFPPFLFAFTWGWDWNGHIHILAACEGMRLFPHFLIFLDAYFECLFSAHGPDLGNLLRYQQPSRVSGKYRVARFSDQPAGGDSTRVWRDLA